MNHTENKMVLNGCPVSQNESTVLDGYHIR